ncbi:MAG: uroporphyrinogen decarboxylase family protein [Lentisphaeria bacterium]
MDKTIIPCRPKWKNAMTDRERFNRQMHYQPVDRCFNMEFGYWEENYHLWKPFVDNRITNEGEANRFFNFDCTGMVGAPWLLPAFEYKLISETATSKTIVDGNGLICEVPKDGHSTIPHYIGSSIQTPDDWKRAKAEHLNPAHPGRQPDLAQILKDHPAQRDYPLGVWCGSMIGQVRDLLTVEGLSYAIYDYPDMVEDMIENQCVLIENFLDAVLPHVQFDYAAGWEDICFKNGPLVSVSFFREKVVPRYKRINAKLKKHGIDIWWIDCDGDVRPILPSFLESGINCLFPFEVMCCCHPGELLKQYGKDLRIMGGFDKIQMAKGPAAIKAYMESLAPWVERGGYIPFCDHRCPPDVSWENYVYYLDLKEQMFGMK